MYKRAVSDANALQPLWHVGEGVSIFAGPLNRNQPHRHSVPVLLTGLYGAFKLQVHGRQWITCRMALVPADVTYAFDMSGEPLSVIYVEPSVANVETLTPLLRNGSMIDGVLVSSSDEQFGLREIYEDPRSVAWAGDALLDVMAFAESRKPREIDPRISVALDKLQTSSSENISVDYIAREIDLSPSRFQHLFTAQVGVPYRRYRAWRRMLDAIDTIVQGANFTTAAHAAGYADQSHFANHFRRVFGAPASPSLSNVRRGQSGFDRAAT